MLYLHGIGCAYPETKIDSKLLDELGGGAPKVAEFAQCGVEQRWSVLPVSYLNETKNFDRKAGFLASKETIRTLGAEAARRALIRASLEPQDIGLVVGDVSTPIETTPSEGQRVASQLGIKVPAYDVHGGPSAMALFSELLLNRKSEQLPDYVLCVTVNAPTHLINYSEDDARFVFGDGAAAWICSRTKPNKLSIREARCENVFGSTTIMDMDPWNGIALSSEFFGNGLEHHQRSVLDECLSSRDRTQIRFIGTQLHLGIIERVAKECGLSPDQSWSSLTNYGFTLGTAPYSVLADNWDKLEVGTDIVVAMGAPGISFGHVVIEVK